MEGYQCIARKIELFLQFMPARLSLGEQTNQSVDHYIADKMDLSGGNPLRLRLSLPLGSLVKSKSATWSIRILLISSGIDWSNDRKPASTWATLIPNLLQTRVDARVELTSPTTMTQSGSYFNTTGSKRSITCASVEHGFRNQLLDSPQEKAIPILREKTSDMAVS